MQLGQIESDCQKILELHRKQKRGGGVEVFAKTRLEFVNYFVVTEELIK